MLLIVVVFGEFRLAFGKVALEALEVKKIDCADEEVITDADMQPMGADKTWKESWGPQGGNTSSYRLSLETSGDIFSMGVTVWDSR